MRVNPVDVSWNKRQRFHTFDIPQLSSYRPACPPTPSSSSSCDSICGGPRFSACPHQPWANMHLSAKVLLLFHQTALRISSASSPDGKHTKPCTTTGAGQSVKCTRASIPYAPYDSLSAWGLEMQISPVLCDIPRILQYEYSYESTFTRPQAPLASAAHHT
jgi:hypothetical protein